MQGHDDREEFGDLEDLDEDGKKTQGGLIQRASRRILEYWQRRKHRGKTGATLTLVELEVERVKEQRALEKELSERFDEPGIGERKDSFPYMAYLVYPLIGLLVVSIPVAVVLQRIKAKDLGPPPERDPEAVLPIEEGEFSDRSAREIAEAFLAAPTMEERLALVRDPEAVRERLSDYPAESCVTPIPFDNLSAMGLASASGEARFHRFAVQMPSGGMRFLPVVQTERGPLVDYDAFARHASASWEELMAGGASAEVRVLVRASTYHQFGFEDESRWQAFELRNPDWPKTLTGYAEKGSSTAGTLFAITGPKSVQRVTLAIRPEGESHAKRQFVIEKVLASGWVRTEGDLESRWLLKGRPGPAN